jgi:hypothetical protein
VSNTRKTREMNGGRWTRPRYEWRGKQRRVRRTPLRADQNAQIRQAGLSAAARLAAMFTRGGGD